MTGVWGVLNILPLPFVAFLKALGICRPLTRRELYVHRRKQMDVKDLLTAFSAIIIAVLTWFFNEQSKRSDDVYKQKDARYLELVNSLKAFYVESPTPEPGDYELSDKKLKNKELIQEFMNQ